MKIKKVIIAVLSIYMFFMFLVYSGIFRDNTNPLDVAKYYFGCIKNREGFLTFSISKPEFFNDDRRGVIYLKYKMKLIKNIKFILLDKNLTNALVQAKIIYKNKEVKDLLVELEKNNKVWLIKNVRFIR